MVASAAAFHTYVAPEHLPSRLKGTDRYVFDPERDLSWSLPRPPHLTPAPAIAPPLAPTLPLAEGALAEGALAEGAAAEGAAAAVAPSRAPLAAALEPLAEDAAAAVAPATAPSVGAASVRPPATTPDGHATAPATALGGHAAAVAEATRCNERFDWAGARAVLAPWTHQHDARTLIERTICNLQVTKPS
jgi:hypothetical protein